MPANIPSYFWKRNPFVRFIIPFIIGILAQFAFNFQPAVVAGFAFFSFFILIVFSTLSLAVKYIYRWVPGIAMNTLMAAAGSLLLYFNDISKKPNWVGNYTKDTVTLLATLREPLVEKAKTFKAEADVEAIESEGNWKKAEGKILIYFTKENKLLNLKYGSQVLFNKPLQEIKNSGNPGSFNYKQYNAFQDIYHQVFLKSGEYVIAKTSNGNAFKQWLFDVRFAVIQRLQQYISGDREAGVAEALLIGYRNDLDKRLVQAYSNTGVVHIIAISGLHLGMIYVALIWLLSPFKNTKSIRWIKPVIILTVLWIFTFLAGGVPSILRSAVMFSFIVLGEAINRKASIYNTLAASAFVMLCINPYHLWDVGFQLSYAAVTSIIIFSKPVYDWFYVNNKILDFFWKLASVTIAAQILTLPIIFFHFHQFPNFFLITNCIIVPLSSVILFAELLLVATSFMPVVAKPIGLITSWMLASMNNFIERINSIPFAVYDGIQINVAETILLYVSIIGISYWLLTKTKTALFAGLVSTAIFVIVDSYEKFRLGRQNKIIVYNIPKYHAIDFISGKKYAFIGDTTLQNDDYLQNFYLKPSRTLHKIKAAGGLPGLSINYPFVQFQGKRILMIDKPYKFENRTKIAVDLIIVSHNPRLYIDDLSKVFDCKRYVFDGSNSTWKINRWKKDCDSLHLRHYSTPGEGAFELNL